MKLETNNTSEYLLRYNLILCTMNRRKVINNTISNRLKEIFLDILIGYGISVENWVYEPDYVWVTIRAEPRTEMSKFINSYKTSSSRRIKNEFSTIKEGLYHDTFWSRGYCLTTDIGVNKETILKYIQSRGGDENDNAASDKISNISKQTTSETA